MNAIQQSQPHLQPSESRRVATRKRQQRHPYRAVAVETTAKLAVNVVLSAAAITALVQLLPYHMSQQTKLREINSEVKQTEKRVNRLQSDFSRYFDPRQAKTVMQEQSHRVDPSQRQVVLMDNGAMDEESSSDP